MLTHISVVLIILCVTHYVKRKICEKYFYEAVYPPDVKCEKRTSRHRIPVCGRFSFLFDAAKLMTVFYCGISCPDAL